MKNTKRSLLFSILAMILCVAMLASTTLAWFTDTASTAVNKIQAGNLDIEVEYSKDGSSWTDIQGTTSLFSNNLWEPGHTEYVYLKVKNAGSLALKYKVMVTPVSENGGINMAGNNFKLSEHLMFGTTVPATAFTAFADRNAARAAATMENGLTQESINNLNKTGTIEANAAEQYLALVVYMPETVGNEANAKPGTTAPSINLGITVVATQLEAEVDSFGLDYDAGAETGASEYVAGPYYDYLEAVNVTSNADENGNFTATKTDTNTGVIASASGTAAAGAEVNTVITKTSAPDANEGNFQLAAGEELKGYDITVTGHTPGTLVQGKLYVGTGLQGFVFYHNGEAMNGGTKDNLTDGQYAYDPTDGFVYFATTSFSPFQAKYTAPVAAIGTAVYGTLSDAIAVAKNGNEVVLVKSVKVSEQINLPAGVTLNGRGFEIKADNASWSTTNGSKMLLQIGANATVKNVTLDSNNQACGVQA